MATDLAPTRKARPIKNLYGQVARVLKRLRSAAKSSSSGGRTNARLQEALPEHPVVQVTTLGNKPVEPGLAAIWGWAFSGERDFPEGVVEAALDDEEEWVVLSDRMPGGCITSADPRDSRCGFHATLNTFLLSNGVHRARLRVKTRSGKVACSTYVPFRVNNIGPLAETTTRLISGGGRPERIRVDLIDSSDFPFAQAREVAWFERDGAEHRVEEITARHHLPAEYQAHLRHFIREGYIVLDDLIARDDCERINFDLDALIASGVFRYEYKGQRIEKLFEHSESTRRVWAHPEILKLLTAIFDDQAVPCQTLNFMHGSQQAVHQDVIHLTPFPQGFMCGVWVALEDIHPDSGPLIVYPGSHRLPRLYTSTVGADKVRDGSQWGEFSARYAPRVKELIDQSGLDPVHYTPKAGAVLIWHENLAHGGSPRNNDELTRKSMVSHYFARGAVSFYDSQGTPAWTTPPDDD